MYFISKKLNDFSAAHRLLKGYQGKCNHLHGHNYGVEITLAASKLNEHDFVLDFSEIKYLFDSWVQKNLDHATLVAEIDTTLMAFVLNEKQKHYLLPNQANTSAESIAKHLFEVFTDLLPESRVQLVEVSVAETSTAKASYRGDDK